MKLHSLAQRQIQEHLRESLHLAPPELKLAMEDFFSAVSSTYAGFESDRELLERSMYKIVMLVHGLELGRAVMPKVAQEVSEATGFPIVAIELYDRKDARFEIRNLIGAGELGASFEGSALSVTDLPYVHLMKEESEAFVSDDLRLFPNISRVWRELKVASLISVPMKSSEIIWGTLTVAHLEPAKISVQLTKWLQTVAKQMAAKLDRERLNELNEQQQAFVVSSSKMSELGKMAGGIAHEINTPLSTILLVTDTLSEKAAKSNRDDMIEPLKIIVKTVERIASIVKGLRSFSREVSKDQLVPANMMQIINSTKALCGERFKQGSVELRVECPANLEIACREAQISQVLLNLLSNAYDAVIDLPEKWITLAVEDFGACIQIVVTDSGSGIPPESQDKLFVPFYTTKNVGEGTGLGLSIAMGIVDAHGGRIELDNSHPHTRFVIFLPKQSENLKPVTAA